MHACVCVCLARVGGLPCLDGGGSACACERRLFAPACAGRLNKVRVDSSGKFAITCGDDNTAIVWDLDSGKRLAELAGHTGGWLSCSGHTGGRLHITVVCKRAKWVGHLPTL